MNLRKLISKEVKVSSPKEGYTIICSCGVIINEPDPNLGSDTITCPNCKITYIITKLMPSDSHQKRSEAAGGSQK